MTKKAITDNFPLTTYSGEKEELVIVWEMWCKKICLTACMKRSNGDLVRIAGGAARGCDAVQQQLAVSYDNINLEEQAINFTGLRVHGQRRGSVLGRLLAAPSLGSGLRDREACQQTRIITPLAGRSNINSGISIIMGSLNIIIPTLKKGRS